MEKRKIIFGVYDTAKDGLLTLTGWQLSEPIYKDNFVPVPGRDGDLDFSTVLTDGEPRYNNRELTATFESSEGTRLDRKAIFEEMQNLLDGRRMNIVLPDDDLHYIAGRVRVAIEYNDPAHGALTVTAICEPWQYAVNETVHVLAASDVEQSYILKNAGRRVLIPSVVVTGAVDLAYGGSNWSLSAGAYTLPDLMLYPGAAIIKYRGTGTLTFRYREAIL